MSNELKPIDGTAVVLHLIEAAREWAEQQSVPSAAALVAWVEELESRYAREAGGQEQVGWEPRRWRELVAGDRVEVGGHEAEIGSAFTSDWHVHPENYVYVQGEGRKYERFERTVTKVKFVGRSNAQTKDGAYDMPPDGEVETLRGPVGQALDEVNGHRSIHAGDPIEVLGSWAAEAVDTLAAAGLGPIEVMNMTEPAVRG